MEFHLGKAIQILRKKRRISQGELAQQLHVSIQAVSKWETGRQNPELSILPGLALLLGVSIFELFS